MSSTNHLVLHLRSADLLFRHLSFGALHHGSCKHTLVWSPRVFNPVSLRERSCLEAPWTFGNAIAYPSGLAAQSCMPRCCIGLDTMKRFAKQLNSLPLSLPYFTTASPLKPLCSLGQSLPSERQPVLPSAAAQQILCTPVEQESICDVQLSEPGEAMTCRL